MTVKIRDKVMRVMPLKIWPQKNPTHSFNVKKWVGQKINISIKLMLMCKWNENYKWLFNLLLYYKNICLLMLLYDNIWLIYHTWSLHLFIWINKFICCIWNLHLFICISTTTWQLGNLAKCFATFVPSSIGA